MRGLFKQGNLLTCALIRSVTHHKYNKQNPRNPGKQGNSQTAMKKQQKPQCKLHEFYIWKTFMPTGSPLGLAV